jgi:hypothetical protein
MGRKFNELLYSTIYLFPLFEGEQDTMDKKLHEDKRHYASNVYILHIEK